jgi:signal transduction histidine kinase
MSHELRTPLNAILGFADIIQQRLFGEDTGRYARYAADIHASGTLLLALITDMLDLARIEAGALRLVEEAIDLHETASAAAQIVRSSAHGRNDGTMARLRLDFDPAMPRFLGDRRAFMQILINLLTNAAKHTPVEGTITLAISRDPAGALVIVIDDEGPGIPPADLPHLFEPFRRRDPTTRGVAEGTGLGLPIVKRLVDLHGGAIEIASGPNAHRSMGTTVTVTLPAARFIIPTGSPD